jgi:prolyl oligopeptidase
MSYRDPSLILALLVALSGASAFGDSPPAEMIRYPEASRGPVIDDYHGTRVADPYRWLEDLDSAKTKAWVKAENALTDGYVAALPMREPLKNRIGQLYNFERFGLPFHAGSRYFYTQNSGLQNQSVLYTTDGIAGEPRVALDPNSLSKDGSLAVIDYQPSRDGRLLAYGVSISGSDWREWHVRDLTSGKELPDVIRHTKYYAPQFSLDGKRIFYSAFPAPAAGTELSSQDLGNAVYSHVLGSPASADRKLLEFAAHSDWQYLLSVSEDGRWLLAASGEGEVGDKGLEDIYLIDLNAANPVAKPIVQGFGAAYVYVGSDAGRLFFLTTADAPKGKIVSLDPQASNTEWQTAVPEGSEAIDLTETSVTLVGHRLIVRTIKDARSKVMSYGVHGEQARELSLPSAGTASGFGGWAADGQTFYAFEDLISPRTIYAYDVVSGKSTVYRQPTVSFDAAKFEQRQVFYRGKDGTRIPMQLAYRKGLHLDGTNPVLLYGYGGFGIPLLPWFEPARIAWLEAGGVYAIANIRGGGEYGEAWHRQAYREHKQVVFDDFIAAAEWLIAQKYTSTPELAIRGESNGGLLVGACLTQRPDLFGAVIAGVGVMDMLRFDLFGQGAGWTGEFGSPQNATDFPAIYAYSPLHHVKNSTTYPPTLIFTGDHDTRVMPGHSFKFTAALQAAQAGKAPILLYIEKSSGHGGGPTVTQAIEQNADVYAFLAKQLGITATQ